MKPNQPESRIRVMLVDDHDIMREGLRTLLAAQPDLIVVAEAESGEKALRLAPETKPDVVLMDSSMPEMSGAETTLLLKKLWPDVKIIGLTLYEESAYLKEMLASGANGYVVKSGSPENLIHAVRTVAAGGTYFDPVVPGSSDPVAQAGTVTPRSTPVDLNEDELAIAKLLAEGHTNAEIATALQVPSSAVATRRTEVMEKLGVRNRAELVRVAAQRQWLDV